MKPANLLFLCGALMASAFLYSQDMTNSAIIDWRQHNLTKYNKSLVNPTYSYVRESSKAVSFWSRVQWTGIENSPQTYLLNYSGKVGENSGAGLALYQQNLGLLVDSGLLLNYAYSVTFSEKVKLAMGLNTTLFRRGLNRNAINATEPDPAILENQDDFLLLFMPGMNLSIGGFDLGVYAENLFDYNFNDARSVTEFSGKIFSSQFAYTHQFKYGVGFMEDASLRTMAYGKSLPGESVQYGINSMIDLPYYGWMHFDYNSVYGIGGGIGVVLGDGISVGINYENGSAQTNNAFGPTIEALATVELGPVIMRKNRLKRNGRLAKAEGDENEESTSEKRSGNSGKAKEAAGQKTAAANDKYAVYGGSDHTAEIMMEEQSTVTITEGTSKEVQISSSEDERKPGAETAARGQETLALLNPQAQKEPTADENSANNTESYTVNRVDTTITGPNVTANETREESGYSDQTAGPVIAENGVHDNTYEDFLEKTLNEANALMNGIKDSTVVTREIFGELSQYKTIDHFAGIEKGFYLVVNVFSKKHYFDAFVKELHLKGFEPEFFIHPKNDYYYVYLSRSDSYLNVKRLQRSDFNGTYTADKWVLWVK
ncbi:PorP/SprF family type IX secretion system membrane protein [Robertkochia aurantiaca]|uniref:PorP/SprF family type IX secretion system membrane protein n=1 Tax=Robertkochia aurantiaca TaxID=2873700 RepID=UPI001CCD15F2|nr:PorP/SprF family type IX secretion system membrane protein [Robertkochia sp. 3YJGBD-33]